MDEIDCFQKPIAIVLNSLYEIYSDIFILYSKTFELYTCYSLREIRYSILDILETMRLKVNKNNNVGLIKFICNEINENNLVIIGLDYYNIFYSEYYFRESYPHWVIANGYNKYSKVISIIDYTQHMKINYKYSDFNMTYDMIKKSNKMYGRNYGFYDRCFSININDSNIDFLEQIKKLLEFIIDVISKENFSIFFWISKINNYLIKNNILEDDMKYFKEQILNINKSRKVFFDKIIKLMYLSQYDMLDINCFSDDSQKLINIYDNSTNINLIHLFNGNNIQLKFNESISYYEKCILNRLVKFREFLNQKSGLVEKIKEDKNTNDVLNDYDNVISIDTNNISFIFKKKKEYNWWQNDNAPKYEIGKIDINEIIEVKTDINICKESTCNFFQVGFYIKNGNEVYFAGIDINNIWCIDKINSDNYSCYLEFIPNQSIYLLVLQDFIEIGNYTGKVKKCILKRYFKRKGKVSVGLSCKKWGDYGKLKVCFNDIKYFFRNL